MRLVRKLFLFVFILIFIAISLVTLIGFTKYKEALDRRPLSKEIKSLREKENYTKLDELPKVYIDAVVAVEDHRFYEHKGVDFISILRAFTVNLVNKELAQGGSTITQQLAKNMYFSLNKKLTRKVSEAFLAHKFEKEYSKDEILEFYLNTSYFGDGYYSVKEASRGYFGKEPKDMTDSEATMLAGIPNAPSVYAPTQNPDLAKQRQKQVIDSMVKYGYLSKEEAEKIKQE